MLRSRWYLRNQEKTRKRGVRVCDVTPPGIVKLKMNKKLGRGYKVHLDFILTAKRLYWRISKSQELVFS